MSESERRYEPRLNTLIKGHCQDCTLNVSVEKKGGIKNE